MCFINSRHTFKNVTFAVPEKLESLDYIADTELKATILATSLIVEFINNNYRSGVSSLSGLKQKLHSEYFGQAFPLFSPFYESFNMKIHHMIDAGLTEYWIQNVINRRGLKRKVEQVGPEILTMEHLDVAFKIILGALLISIIVFLIEIIFSRCRKYN